MRQKISNATIFFALGLLVVMAPVTNADLPSHSLEVGDSFLHDFSFSYQDSVNGTDLVIKLLHRMC
ncbi:MAG: hypothetical protein D6732_02495 [Methanobacteriota archaeon]|nr:MAG: hypothetical protein D6732_02495 [Euryarchaeota archaeon]